MGIFLSVLKLHFQVQFGFNKKYLTKFVSHLVLSLKKLSPKKCKALKIFHSQFLVQQIYGSQKCWFIQKKNFGSKDILCPKNFASKKFGLKKMLDQISFGSKEFHYLTSSTMI